MVWTGGSVLAESLYSQRMLRLPHPVVTAQRNALAAALEISMRRAERAEAEVQVARMLAERRPPVMIPQQRNAEDPRPPK